MSEDVAVHIRMKKLRARIIFILIWSYFACFNAEEIDDALDHASDPPQEETNSSMPSGIGDDVDSPLIRKPQPLTPEEIEERRQKIDILSKVHRLAYLMKRLKEEKEALDKAKGDPPRKVTPKRTGPKKKRGRKVMTFFRKTHWRPMFRMFWQWLKRSRSFRNKWKRFNQGKGRSRGRKGPRGKKTRRFRVKGNRDRNRQLMLETLRRLNGGSTNPQ